MTTPNMVIDLSGFKEVDAIDYGKPRPPPPAVAPGARPVLLHPHPQLREPAVPVREDLFGTLAIHEVAYALLHTVRAHVAAGVAATQLDWDDLALDVGKSVREVFGGIPAMFAVLSQAIDENGAQVWIVCNPEPIDASDYAVEDEGCLSFPGMIGPMRGPRQALARFHDPDGKPWQWLFRGVSARACAHEAEHLHGRLMIDRMGALARRQFLQRFEKQQSKKGRGR